MSDTQIMMKVPEEVITAQVRAAVAQVLSKDPARMIEAVVRMALEQKKDHYSRETMFVEVLHQMIRDLAKEEFAAWCEEQRPQIRKAIADKLRAEHKSLVDGIASSLANAATSIRVDAYLERK